MLRLFAALLFTAAVAVADEPPKKPVDPPKPAEPVKAAPTAAVTLKTLAVKDGMVVSTQPVTVTEFVVVQEVRVVNGQNVTVARQVPVTKTMMQETKSKLKDMKATGTDGKDIAGDDLEKKLKDGGTVVMHTGKLGDEFRKLFKDGTVFVEQVPPELKPAPPGTGGPALPPAKPK